MHQERNSAPSGVVKKKKQKKETKGKKAKEKPKEQKEGKTKRENEMKKLITAMLCLMPVMAFGANVCIKNNSYFNLFRPSVDGTSSEADNTNKVWKVVFPYRTITGKASCNAISQVDSANVVANQVVTNLYTGAADVGSYCWCEMWPVESYYSGQTNPETGPTSYWLFLKSYANDGACSAACATDCASAVRYDTGGFRTAMFESMW